MTAFSSRCSSNGSGRFEARPAQAQEQPVRRIRLVFHVEQDLHDVTYRRDIPELGVDARPGGRPGQDGLEFFLPDAGGFRCVLVPGAPGRRRAHPRALPPGQPFPHVPLRPFDPFSDDAHIDATGGVQNRFGLHPDEHVTAKPLLRPDQDGGFFWGDLNRHAPIISRAAQEIHGKYGFVSCRP